MVSRENTSNTLERSDVFLRERVQEPSHAQRDVPTREEPLEIRVDGEPVALTLRTPGADEELALGFLCCEGVIRSLDDVMGTTPGRVAGPDGERDMIDVTSAPNVDLDIERALDSRRFTVLHAVCGRHPPSPRAIPTGALVQGPTLSTATIAGCAVRFGHIFTGEPRFRGLEVVAAFSVDGEFLSAHADIGRPNAADKVIGELLRQRRLGSGARALSDSERPAVLAVNGSPSFELVQKTAAARIPVIVSDSPGSALTVGLAVALRVTLVTLGRDGSLRIYSCPERLGEPLTPALSA
ncbi:formate dehydrogenase accessory sulfurtransferase FdhD [Chondromyces crocatus]|nr:formate dehydrogenase accessory sulfurtransferase FdhD [Chondromyces crocatus]